MSTFYMNDALNFRHLLLLSYSRLRLFTEIHRSNLIRYNACASDRFQL